MLNACDIPVYNRIRKDKKMYQHNLVLKTPRQILKRCCWSVQTQTVGIGQFYKTKLCGHLSLLMFLFGLMTAPPFGAAQTNDEPNVIKPTPALRQDGADDLTTVLLVNNDGVGRLGDGHGRYLSVRPEVGLLTSTARTFIQEGTTTEYATQVVGTTLENGRLYAQYLKKSSRVLFENGHVAPPSVITSWVGDSVQPYSRSYIQSHNDLFNADAPNWRDIDESLDDIISVPGAGKFVGNTDYLNLKVSSHLLPMEMPVVTLSTTKNVKKNSGLKPMTISGYAEDTARKLAAQKVLPMGDLPTFTVKNHFEPSGHLIIENSDRAPYLFDVDAEEGRSAKVYYQHIMRENQSAQRVEPQILNYPKRVQSTVTYYGFADFTTIVGDSIIVFSPSTAQPGSIVGHVTSIKGMATLRTTDIPNQIVKSTETKDSIKLTDTLKTAEIIVSTALNNEDVLKAAVVDTLEVSSSQYTPEINNLLSTPTPSLDLETGKPTSQFVEVTEEKSMFSLPTDQEIQEIYVSLSKAQAKEHYNLLGIQSTEPHLQAHGGATTIFVDDDPFANFIEPTRVANSTVTKISDIIDATTSMEEAATLDKPDLTSDNEVNTTPLGTLFENSSSVAVSTLALFDSTQPLTIVQEITNKYEEGCDHISSQIFLTQLPTSLTILSIDNLQNSSSITNSETSSYDIKETTKYYCIKASKIKQSTSLIKSSNTDATFDSTTEADSDFELKTTQADDITTMNSLEESQTETTTTEATVKTESSIENDNDYVTESENNQENENDNENEDYDTENDLDEIDLIYKTLFTTYTYLTTFFQSKSTIVSSHTQIVTNVITSIGSSEHQENLKTEDIMGGVGDAEKSATQTDTVTVEVTATAKPSKYIIPGELDSLLYASANDAHNLRESNQDTSYLDDTMYTKTFFTTYTYYTTIFADKETEIMSRIEVFTNYVTEQGTATAQSELPNDVLISTISPTLDRTSSVLSLAEKATGSPTNVDKVEEHITLVTDVRSSSSSGEQHVIGQLRDNLDDQVSSESNTEEILPSPTLLLQTSFTTFTFYTTMYVADITNVVSRLETVTNIATETVQPTKLINQEEASLPITYFTTFTYWTKLAKDGEITTISREETISNVIEPTKLIESAASSSSIPDSIKVNQSNKSDNSETSLLETMSAIPINASPESNLSALTTYYTTYTYYTTSYEYNTTVTDSRLETITNIIRPTSVVNSSPLPNPVFAQTSILSVDTAQLTSSVSMPSSDSNTSDLIFYDYKHIIDADGVSTLYFTTKIQPSINEEGSLVELTSSTSSLYIDETKKFNLVTSLANESVDDQDSVSLRQYKTGLVRLIEGTRIGNSTTTLYQSKVIGTIIDNRYAQIIESTSSFIFEKVIPDSTISPSVTSVDMIVSTTESVHLDSVNVVEGSINSDSTEIHFDEHDDENNINNARLPLQSKRRTFAPVIRPFASRSRPTFAPKQKTQSPSSATIITRSDITPTITATPALKSVGKFGSSRRGSLSNAPHNPHDTSSTSSTTFRRLFGRPIKPSVSQLGSSIGNIQASSSISQSRNRFASTFRTSQASSTRRLNLSSAYRPSSSNNLRVSAQNVVNSRQRIKPSAVFTAALAKTSADHNIVNIEEENSTEIQIETHDEEDIATENSKRNQNPLLRFRRPLSRPTGFTPVPRASVSPVTTISPRRNPFVGRAKASTTSTTTTTTTAKPRPRSFQRPTISSIQTRARPQNHLFPPRGLFQTQQQKEKDELTVNKSELNQNENDFENDSEYDDDDADEDGSDDDVQNEENRRRRSNKTILTQSTANSRPRRQADSLNRSRFRFRRPKTATTEEPKVLHIEELNETTLSTPRMKINSRFGSRFQSQSMFHSQQTSSTQATTSGHRPIRPTRPTSPRTQFTLREKDTTIKSITRQGGTSSSNFRRQQPTIRRTNSSPNSRRLKSYTNHNHNTVDTPGPRTVGSARSRNGNANGSNRGRGSMRGRIRNDYNQDATSTDLGGGMITVTHIIPAEVTVPVINGQVTEYKYIVTGKTSLEVLGPHQYTKILGNNGQSSLFLTREDSSVSPAGVTELTRYLLHDSATTTVTFTPTTIRGRQTSFSHILPSTVYSVENIVSTVQPQISANAPLANILLSQLLLGNINLPANQLLGALGQPQGVALEPSLPPTLQFLTEYRTHTSTYVTTIYDGKSTILPITFQGKKILTTVFDTTAQTITATEYSVDTIINTPTQHQQQVQQQTAAHVAQVNSLLLQQLLLQQQQQQIPQVSQTTMPQIFLSENLQDLDDQVNADLDVHDNIDDIIVSDSEHDERNSSNTSRKKLRKSGKSNKRNKPKSKEDSSVITLYVSGRRPGEFSTILSTVQNTFEHSSGLHKRQVYAQPIKQTAGLYGPEDLYEFGGSEKIQLFLPLGNFEQEEERKKSIKSTLDECQETSCELKAHTASLESIIGDVDLWYSMVTKQAKVVPFSSTTLTDPSNFTPNFLA